jgi:hypothetical protein
MQWPAWLTWYKKPDYRDIKEYSAAVGSGKRSFSPDARGSKVPSQLKLERVLDNKTCMYTNYANTCEERDSAN